MIFKKLKHKIKNLFTPIVNLRNGVIDESLINSLEQYNKSEIVLLKIPIENCVLGMFWRLNERNPFVKSLISNDYSVLTRYYQEFQPSNINELFALDLKNDYGKMEPYSYTLPWNSGSPQFMLKRRNEVAMKENKRKGGKNLSLSVGGHTDFGPVSENKLNIEISRLTTLFLSIRKQGFKERSKKNDGGIKGYFLLDRDMKWKFYINGGKHRAYVLAALGYREMPVILNHSIRTVKINNISKWPQVVNGNYDHESAQLIFRRFFE